MSLKKIIASIASVGLLTGGLTAVSVVPAEAANTKYKVCANQYNKKVIKYDKSWRDGYQWKTLSAGKCITAHKDDTVFKTTGKSIGVAWYGTSGSYCFNRAGSSADPLRVNPVYKGKTREIRLTAHSKSKCGGV